MKTTRWTFGWASAAAVCFTLGCETTDLPDVTAPSLRAAVRPQGAAGPDEALLRDAVFTTVDVPGAVFTEAHDIAARGDIVGRYTSPDGKNHGYLLHEGTVTTIDVSASYTGAQGLNDRGDVVGQYLGGDGRFHGFRWRDGAATTIDVAGAVATRALGINDAGDIVGAYCDPACPSTAYRADLGNHGFVLHDGIVTTIDYPGALVTEAFKINRTGAIVGRYEDAQGSWHVFRLREGVFTAIDVPGAIQTASFPPPVGINAAGDIVSSFCPATPCPVRLSDNLATLAHIRGFLFRAEDRDDPGQFTTIEFPGAVATAAFSINARGDIVGAYADANRKVHGFLWSRAQAPVPVAGTFAFTLTPVATRQVDGTAVTDFSFEEQISGTVAGVRVGTGTLVAYPDGTISVHDAGRFTGTVGGVLGSVLVEVRAAGTLASFGATARFDPSSGTGGLQGVQGTVTVSGGATGPTTLAGSYRGAVRFQPSAAANDDQAHP